jgi:SpoVK/Ycf46/Vps4 family AAA+-type ATPase
MGVSTEEAPVSHTLTPTVSLGEEPFLEAVASYAHNLLVSTGMRRLQRADIDVLEDVPAIVGLALQVDEDCDKSEGGGDDAQLSGKHLHRHLRAYLREWSKPRRITPADEPVRSNLRLVEKTLGLDSVEGALLAFLVALHSDAGLKRLTERFGEVTLARGAEFIAAAVRLRVTKVLGAIKPTSRLVQSGLLEVLGGPNELALKFQIHPELLEAVSMPALDREGLLARFVERAPAPTISLGDFKEVEAGVGHLMALLQAAVKSGARGINVLLHGSTGVGKTQLAHLLAQMLGVPLFVVGRADDAGESPVAQERLQSLLLASRMAAPGQALLLFDELEDLFAWELTLFGPSRATTKMSKQWFNSLLENNPIPTIWITNRLDGIDEAFLRRFTFALELRAAGPRQRATVLRRHVGDALPSDEIEAIASRYDATPGQIATAVRAARMVAPGEKLTRESVERYLAPVESILRGKDPRSFARPDARTFRLDAIHSTEDLGALADRLATWQRGEGPGISLCFYGPPGTGKSEYVKYLAGRMGRRLVSRRISEIQSMWVGGTEKAIAQAFADADAEDAVLLFDEADSYLRDRTRAVTSWEQTAVNEFLTQLESFRGVVACTTNLWRDIDEAALRRFVFKVEFRFLRPEQAQALFRAFFPEAVPGSEEMIDARLRRMASLAPGDFAAVARRTRALGALPDADALIRMLEAEVSVKRVAPRPVGF